MKVIAKSSRGFICEVTDAEIQKYMNTYYRRNIKETKIKEGEDIDLGLGYNHAEDIRRAVSTLKDHIKANNAVFDVIQKGLHLVADSEQPEKDQDQ